jgi:hypothetical protein
MPILPLRLLWQASRIMPMKQTTTQKLPPRLVWQASRLIPMTQPTTRHGLGSSVVLLHNQQVAIVSYIDSVVYILDTKTLCATSTFRYSITNRHDDPINGANINGQGCPYGTIYYWKGHLVHVTCIPNSHTVYIWKVEEDNQGNACSINFLYGDSARANAFVNDHAGGRSVSADIVVAGNGKMYKLQEQVQRSWDNAGAAGEQVPLLAQLLVPRPVPLLAPLMVDVFDLAPGRHVNTIHIAHRLLEHCSCPTITYF